MTATSSQKKRVATLLGIAQFGYAQWFFGNLYEWVVSVPNRLAADGRLGSVLSAGSPVLYYLPGGLILIAATLAAVITAWKSRLECRSLAGLAFAVLVGLSATAYLVWTVNLKLFIIGHSVEPVERSRLLTMWYRVNAIRLVTTGYAWIAAAHIGSRLRSDAEKP
jgi:hypothetical protein